jgi:hypothetical protein
MFRRVRGWMVAAVLLAISQPALAQGVPMTESERQLVAHALAQIASTPAVREALAGA